LSLFASLSFVFLVLFLSFSFLFQRPDLRMHAGRHGLGAGEDLVVATGEEGDLDAPRDVAPGEAHLGVQQRRLAVGDEAVREADAHHPRPLGRGLGEGVLEVLEHAGLVQARRDGRYKFHHLDLAPLRGAVADWLDREP